MKRKLQMINRSALVLGSGGREHAIVEKLSKENVLVYAYPGNPGIFAKAQKTPIMPDDFNSIRSFAVEKKIGLVVIGPEAYLDGGLTDYLRQNGVRVFGPTRSAARIETDKSFAKHLMKDWGVPTADYRTAHSRTEFNDSLKHFRFPFVVKVSGLAAGKGAFVIMDEKDLASAVEEIFEKNTFKDAASVIVIEEFMQGEEASLFVVTDGRKFTALLPAQDHKRAYDSDKGPNTGGMGSYAPAGIMDRKTTDIAMSSIVEPVLKAISSSGEPFTGLLYAGLMISEGVPRVVEFNARFGDPETQSILTLMESSLFELMIFSSEGSMQYEEPVFMKGSAATVVIAAQGYPNSYRKGMPVDIDYSKIDSNTFIYHAGTSYGGGGTVSSGGRILNITSVDETLEKSISRVYSNIRNIEIGDTFYRKDIGVKGLKYEK